MAHQGNESGDLDIDVASLFGSIWRNKGKLLATAAMATVLTGAVLLSLSPKYQSEARVEFVQQETAFTRPAGTTPEELRAPFSTEAINSQLQVITSADILSAVLSDKQVSVFSEIKDLNEPGFVEGLLATLGLSKEQVGTDRLVEKVRDRLEVFRVENSNSIVINYSAKNPQLAALLPNKIAEAYLQYQAKSKRSTDDEATRVLKDSIDKLEKDLPRAEKAVADYRSQNDIMLGTSNSALATQQLSELSTELSRVRGTRASAVAKAQTVEAVLKSGGSLDSVPDILASTLMQRLIERQVQLRSQIADLSATLLDSHPQMKSLRSQVADLDSQVRNEAAKIERSLKTEAQTAANREAELVAKLNTLKAESARVSDSEVKLRELEREANGLRDLLESNKAKYREAVDRTASAAQKPDARIVQEAVEAADPYFPKYIPSLGAAFVGTLLFSSIFLLMRELFSGRAFRTAAMPPVQDNRRHAAAPASLQVRHDDGLLQDNYSDARSVANRLIDEGESTALIVSPEGPSACAASVMIAREMADQGLNVVLLDLSGSSAAARPMLDGLAMPGITNLLAGESQIAAIVHKDAWSEASVIPTGTADQAKAARAVARLPMIINALASAHDMVLIECGAATAAGLKRIVMPGSRLLVAVINPDSQKVAATMRELAAAGYADLEMVLLTDTVGDLPQSGLSAA